MQLQGKVALVTGASSGIGRATAIRFAREGARVALLGRNTAALGEVADEIREIAQTSETSLLIVADVRDPDRRERAVESAVERFGSLDILVNAAGVLATGTVENTDLQSWREMFEINVDAVFHLTQLATPHLKSSKGAVVNVSSVTGLRAFPGVLAYCASKAAVDQITRCTALELAADGIRVNAVNPGVVVTELHRRGGMEDPAYEAFLEHSKSTHPLGKVGRPEDVAEAILYLASEGSSWVTGVTLSVDGGRQLTCAR
jgi:NAD(P)-dependent dehydrogenase (short-subunit alcohol dehydrogenase family)